jgi:hypothetical protein
MIITNFTLALVGWLAEVGTEDKITFWNQKYPFI